VKYGQYHHQLTESTYSSALRIVSLSFAGLSFSDAFSTANDMFADKRKFLEAANFVYHESWGKDLGTLLKPVPDYPKFKYLSEEKVNSLHLRDLGYPETALLVRTEYKLVYADLQARNNLTKSRGRGGVVVTGQPGIGTCASPTVFFLNINQVQREDMLPVLSPVETLKLEENCRVSRKRPIHSPLSRHWRPSTQYLFW